MKKQIVALAMLATLAPAHAKEGDGLRALAEAYQKEYVEMKKLGRGLNKSKAKAIHEQLNAPAMRLFTQDRAAAMERWRALLKENFGKMRIQQIDGPKGSVAAAGAPAAAPAAASGGRDSDGTTGSSEGAGGAKKVHFGDAKDKPAREEPSKHMNADGILEIR